MKKSEINKKLFEYMNRKYRFEIVEDEDEGGFVISYPDLPGCLSSGSTIEAAVKNGEEAKKEWFYSMLEDDQEIPEPFYSVTFSGEFRIRMPKSLHRRLAIRSKEEGISMNQYCLYLLSKNDALNDGKNIAL